MSEYQFNCCIGDCQHILLSNPLTIQNHIKLYHPATYNMTSFLEYHHCKKCETFTSSIHHHCHMCNTISLTKEDNDFHNSLYHTKWFLEKDCIYGQDCIYDDCYYNHYLYKKNYIIEKKDIIPMSVCTYDLPWLGIRCNQNNCPLDHFANYINISL